MTVCVERWLFPTPVVPRAHLHHSIQDEDGKLPPPSSSCPFCKCCHIGSTPTRACVIPPLPQLHRLTPMVPFRKSTPIEEAGRIAPLASSLCPVLLQVELQGVYHRPRCTRSWGHISHSCSATSVRGKSFSFAQLNSSRREQRVGNNGLYGTPWHGFHQ